MSLPRFTAVALLSLSTASAVAIQAAYSQAPAPGAPGPASGAPGGPPSGATPGGPPRMGGGLPPRAPAGPPPPPLPDRTTMFATSGARAQYKIPDLGPNVYIFDPSVLVADMNALFRSMAGHSNGRDNKRVAVFFLPGVYGAPASGDQKTATGFISSTVGPVTSFQGLGATPNDVTINGNLRVLGNLGTFWRSVQNMRFQPVDPESPGVLRFKSSEAAPLRRLDVVGDLDLGRGNTTFGAENENIRVSGTVYTGMVRTEGAGQAHYPTFNSQVGAWVGESINFVFAGVIGAPPTNFGLPTPTGPGDKTTLETMPTSRDAPFLFVQNKKFNVFVPKVRLDSRGISWGMSSKEGEVQSIDRYLIAKPTDSAAKLNAALKSGKNLLLTPGLYELDEALHVTRPNTVILGIGYATLRPMKGTAAIMTDDVAGAVVSSLLVDSGPALSDTLIQVGPKGATRGVKSNPTTLIDVFIRGGATGGSGQYNTGIEINQNYAQINHTWIWRADGNPASTSYVTNGGEVGLVVNGANVDVHGAYVEHHRKQQVIWNGDAGRVIFMQFEPTSDLPKQAQGYLTNVDNPKEKGYPYFELSPKVSTFDGVGFAPYGSKDNMNSVQFKAPRAPGVKFRSISGSWLYGAGGYENTVNDDGLALGPDNPHSYIKGISAIRPVAAWPATARASASNPMMRMADSDKDGRVNEAEFAAFRKNGWSYYTHDAAQAKAADMPPEFRGAFTGAAVNADGTVSRESFAAQASAQFKSADKNGDGFIDADELMLFMVPPRP